MPPSKPLALQADFDEAVSTNIEDFDMHRTEAVVAALEELKLQVRSKKVSFDGRRCRSKTSTTTDDAAFPLSSFFSHDSRAQLRHTKLSNRVRTSQTSSPRGKRRWLGEDGQVKRGEKRWMLQRREGDGRCFFFSSSLIIRPPSPPPPQTKPQTRAQAPGLHRLPGPRASASVVAFTGRRRSLQGREGPLRGAGGREGDEE